MNILGELRHAARRLMARPAYALPALLTLVLGIGANTAIYSVTKAVLLNPLPYPDPERLVVVGEVSPEGNPEEVAPPTFADFKAQADRFESLAAYRMTNLAFAESREPVDTPTVLATPDLFRVLGTEAALGRTFTAEEGIYGNHRVALLGHAFWQRHFRGDPSVVGRAIELAAEPHTVVGVLPEGFVFPPASQAEVYTALAFNPQDRHATSRQARSLIVIGRLRPDATLEHAATQLAGIASRLQTEFPTTNGGWSTRVVPVHEQLVAASRRALFVLLGAVGFLLLIVCANVANLMLARTSARRREMALRTALGASRLQLVRPVLAESLVLSLAGGALGVLVAVGLIRLVQGLPPGSLPRLDEVRVDAGVLLFTIGVSFAVAIVCGLLPALHASRSGVREDLSESGGATATPGVRRALGALVVIEVALALALLVGAGLLARSFSRLMEVDPGFEPRNLVAAQVYLPRAKYRAPHEVVGFFERALERLRQLPGVRSVAASTALPMNPVGIDYVLPFTIEGQAPPDSGEEPRADIRVITPGYVDTMGMSLLQGRLFQESDTAEAPPVSLINETMARRYFRGLEPVGRVVQNAHGASRVVGVVSDVKHEGLASDPRAEMYVPLRQSAFPGMELVVRTEGDPQLFLESVRRAIWDVDPDQPIFDLTTMTDAISRSVFLPRISMQVLAAFALVALLMAAVGIYGVISYSVTQRTREIGLRMALGAARADTLRLVIGGSMLLVAGGVVLGLAASSVLTRSLRGLLFEVSPLDPAVFSVVALLLGGVGLVASLLPARRASGVDPAVALRNQ